MSQEEVQKLTEKLSNDLEFFKAFSADPEEQMKGFNLTPKERESFLKVMERMVPLGESKECSVCGNSIVADCYSATFTRFRLGTTHTDSVNTYFFHQECYKKGKSKLIGELSGLPQGAGFVAWDHRDPEGEFTPLDATKKIVSGIDFTNTLPRILWKFIKANWLIILIALFILSELIRRYIIK